MEWNERITYDPKELIQLMEHRLDKLRLFQYDARYRELLGPVFIEKLVSWEKNIKGRRDDPFTIVVCGEFKRGKSSLINALLGEDAVTTNVTTETVTLNRLSYGSHSNEAVLPGGRRMRLSDEELERRNLEKLVQQAGGKIQQLELKRPIGLLQQVTIIDTPGLGDSLKDFSSLVGQALQQADAVIYVFSVSYPLSRTEQFFLKTEVLPQKYTDIFLVGNYADMLRNEEEYGRMRELLLQKTKDLLPGLTPWMLSALDERCAQQGQERPNALLEGLLGEQFAKFLETLQRRIGERRELVLPDRMQRMFQGMEQDLSEILSAMEEGLAMESKDAGLAMEKLKSQWEQQAKEQEEVFARLDSKILGQKAEAYQQVETLLGRMREEVDTLGDMEAEEITKYYTFYCIDTLQEAMNRCLDLHMQELYEMLESLTGEPAKGLPELGHSRYQFRFALDNRTWTKGDNVSYMISKVNAGFLSVVADGIAGAMRKKEMAGKTPELLGKIKEQYTGLHVSCLKAVEGLYGKMSENMKKQLDGYYGSKTQAAKEQAEQSAMVARQDAGKKAEIQEAIAQVWEILGEIKL